jgi:hypothetical protein
MEKIHRINRHFSKVQNFWRQIALSWRSGYPRFPMWMSIASVFHHEQHCLFLGSFRISINLWSSIHQTLLRINVSIGWDRELVSILGIRRTHRIWRDSGLTETRVGAAARQKQKMDPEWITRDKSAQFRYCRPGASEISEVRSQKLNRCRILSSISIARLW